MANRQSTIKFTEVTEPLLKELEDSGFDLRSIVNAGILLFSQLSGDEQKAFIKKATNQDNNSEHIQLHCRPQQS